MKSRYESINYGLKFFSDSYLVNFHLLVHSLPLTIRIVIQLEERLRGVGGAPAEDYDEDRQCGKKLSYDNTAVLACMAMRAILHITTPNRMKLVY